MISATQQLALQTALAGVEAEDAGKTGALAVVTTIASIAEREKYDLGDVLEAYSLGAKSKGDKLLCKTLAAIYGFAGAWVTMGLVTYGVYASVRDVASAAGSIFSGVKKAVSFLDPGQIASKAWERIKTFFGGGHDGEGDLIKALPTLVGSAVPGFAVLYNNLSSVTHDHNSLRPRGERANAMVVDPKAGGFDIAYDEDGNSVDMDSINVGDIAYDEDGGKHVYDGARFVAA